MSVTVYISNDGWQTESVLYSTENAGSTDTIIGPKIKNEVNKTGSFSFTILPNHSKYSQLHKMKTHVRVVRDNTVLFIGRVLDIKRDFYKQRNVTCEGALSFLLDSVIPPMTATTMTVGNFFRNCITTHNSMVEDAKKFTIGQITVPSANSNEPFELTSYGKTSDVIDSELLQIYGGVLVVRHSNGTNYIDYLADPVDSIGSYTTNSQPIEFGVNLLDLEEEYPIDDLFTVLLPIGKDNKVLSGTPYLVNQQAVNQFGRIVHVEQWSDIENENELRSFGQTYLDQHSGILPNDLIVKAIDLHHTSSSISQLKILDRIHVYSEPHGLDTTMVCLVVEYDIHNPESDSYRIGTFVKANKRKKTPVKSSSRSRGGSGKSGRSSGLSSKNASLTENVETFTDQALKDITINAKNIDINAKDIKANADNIELNANEILAINGREIVINGEKVSIDADEIDITGKIDNLLVDRLTVDSIRTNLFAGKTIYVDKIRIWNTIEIDNEGWESIASSSYVNTQINNNLNALSSDQSNLLSNKTVYFGSLQVKRNDVFETVATVPMLINGYVSYDEFNWNNLQGKPGSLYSNVVVIGGTRYNFWMPVSYTNPIVIS